MSTHDPYHAPRPGPGQAPGYGQTAGGYGAPAYGGPGGDGGPGPYGGDPRRVGRQPGKPVGFVEAVRRMYSKYAQFSGRASRSEYWWVQLFLFLVYAVVLGLSGTIGSTAYGEPNALGTVLSLLLLAFVLGSLVPLIALGVRRLHDANFSGWLYLLGLIPFVGGIIMLVLTLMPSRPEGARFDR